MFTGIIEELGIIEGLVKESGNLRITVKSPISNDLRIDQSVAHNGVCLTVVEVVDELHTVIAIEETLSKTTLKRLKTGDLVNLERCMPANGRFDGHIVQGHVDNTATLISIEDKHGSWVFSFSYDPKGGHITVEKGSICVNGTSLTCFDVKEDGFSVALIPYTFEHTTFGKMKVGDEVNLEFDIIGKYVQRLLQRN